jgi:hypothetical protein
MEPAYRRAFKRWLNYYRDCAYWAAMASRMEKMDGRLALASALLSSATVASLATKLSAKTPEWLQVALTGGLAIASAICAFVNRHKGYGKKAATYTMIRALCLQQMESWIVVRDALYERRPVPAELIEELLVRDAAVLVHEAGHNQDNDVAAPCELAAREAGDTFIKKWKEKKANGRTKGPGQGREDRQKRAT